MGEYDKKPSKAAPTAGPAADDRYGAGKVGQNVAARIIKCDIVGERTLVTIAKGRSHGVHDGMEGYIKAGSGMLSEFQLHGVGDAISYAFVDVIPDQLRNHLAVVLNPTSMPRSLLTKDTPTRVLSVSVEGGRTKIIIARGSAHGVARGTRGQLRTADGREGDDFTVEAVTTLQAFAFIANSVDYVNAHQHVVLHPNNSKAAPIQLRSNGAAASTADVQSTAHAGVAGAATRLPHFDTIQRAFGKHDISGIQAQVGGAAADASHSLGAQAYATGNKVAFASAPDLHTAAHEAAHTIQQARGDVDFQGLGAADDEHERHADAVADAVVAGRSAESMLDAVTGSGETGGVQRRTDPYAMTSETHTTLVELLLQQAAEATEAALQQNHSPDLLNAAMRVVSRTAQAIAAIDVPGPSIDMTRLGAALDVTYVALEKLQAKMNGHSMLRGRSEVVVSSVADALRTRFASFGWKPPKNAKERADRDHAGTILGTKTVSGEEHAQLAVLHVRAARQYVLDEWSKVGEGEVRALSQALVRHLRSSSEALLDPQMAPAKDVVGPELDAFEDVFERVFISLEKSHPAALPVLARAARETDDLRRLLSRAARWTAKIPYVPVPVKRSANGTTDANTFSHADDEQQTNDRPLAPFCVGKDTSVAGCTLPEIRPYLFDRFTDVVSNAKTNYKMAASSLIVGELLKKEDDLPWLLTLALEIAGGHLLSLVSKAVVALKAAGAASLAANISGAYVSDTSLTTRAEMLLRGISDKAVEGKVRAAYDPARKAGLSSLKSAVNSEATTAKGQNVQFLKQIRNGCDATFGEFAARAIATATDEDYVVLNEGLHERHHTIETYEKMLAAKLARFRRSKILDIGRPQGHELRVVWVEQSDKTKSLWYQSNTLTAPETVTHSIRKLGEPEVHTPFGKNRAASPKLDALVPSEFRETALARSEKVWGPTPTISSDNSAAASSTSKTARGAK